MQVLDSLIDGPLELSNEREGNELIGMIVRYLRTGAEPAPRTDAQKMALAMVRPVLEKSRARIIAGSKGGSESISKPLSKTGSKPLSKTLSNQENKQPSDIYSSSLSPNSLGVEESGEEGEAIPYADIVGYLNAKIGTSYRPTSQKTKRLIHARWAEGFRLTDFRAVIDTMHAAWGNDAKMACYLRPETLFGSKFEGYLNRANLTNQKVGCYDVYD